MSKKVRLAVGVGALVVAASIGGVIAAGAVDRGGSRRESPAPALTWAQSSSASSGGVTLTAINAAFSGTETAVALRVAVDAGALPGGSALRRGAPISLPAGAMVASPDFAGGGAARVEAASNGDALLVLGPVSHPGPVRIEIGSIELRTTTGTIRVSGNWSLELNGPSTSEFPSVMRVERMAPSTFSVNGTAFTVEAVRSSGRTMVSYSLPDGWRQLAPARVLQGKDEILPFAQAVVGGNRMEVSFLPDGFGAPLRLRLGPFGVPGEGGSTVTFNLAAALARQRVDATTGARVSVGPEDVILGEVGRVLEVSFGEGGLGRYGSGEWIEVLVAGTLQPLMGDPAVTGPHLFDGGGSELKLGSLIAGNRKQPDGTVTEGTSQVRFLLAGKMDMSRVTLLLGQRSLVVPGANVTMSPAP
jgi:hypothetical protein